MVHRGKLLKQKIKSEHISTTDFARRHGFKSRTSVYKYYERADAPLDLFVTLINEYGVSFTETELPDLNTEMLERLGSELIVKRGRINLNRHNAIVMDLQRRFILERDHNDQYKIVIKELEEKVKRLESLLNDLGGNETKN